MKFAVISFPGSNCDQDVCHVTGEVLQVATEILRHDVRQDLTDYDTVILPGGFSYGDYLRSGAIARFSPIMEDVINYAEAGGLVLGICNGFQILLEAGLLPGAMKVNDSVKFVCHQVAITVESSETAFTGGLTRGETLQMPVAHQEGNYYIDPAGLEQLKADDQIVFRYLNQEENPNGSLADIAGVCNQEKNVLGLMPHPERASEKILGSEDGKKIFASLLDYLSSREES